MAWTDGEVTRVLAIENELNKLWTAVNNMASKLQFRQLMLLKQDEINSLEARITSLESQLTALQQSGLD